MKKRFISLMLAAATVLSMTSMVHAEENKDVVIAMMAGEIPADVQLVEDELNKLIGEKLDVNVKLQYFSNAEFDTKMNLMLASRSEQIDLLPVIVGNWANYVSSGRLTDIGELYETYGTGIQEYLDDQYLASGTVNGTLYGVPAIRCWAASAALFIRTDVLELAGLETIPEQMSIYELTDVFAKIHEADSSIPILGPAGGNEILNRYYNYDVLGDGFGVLMDYGQSTTVENYYATEEYKDLVNLMYEWNQAGYIAPDSEIFQEIEGTMVRNGLAAAWIGTGDPGALPVHEVTSGYDLTQIELTDPIITTSGLGLVNWTLPITCKNPEGAMKVLNEMYYNKEVVDLLWYGVEGVHYERIDDILIKFPEGVTAENSGYGVSNWYVGNQFITSCWEDSGADYNQKQKEFVEKAPASKAMGFTFDSTEYATELAALASVEDQYVSALECGTVNPEEVLPEFIQALEDAGIQTIIDAKQEQLDAWLAVQNS